MSIPQELTRKTKDELIKRLSRLRGDVRDARFKVMARESKNVRQVRKIRKEVAHILTLLNRGK